MSEVELRHDEIPDDEGPVLARRPVDDSADMDITPMIDITFLLLIFFLVCSTMSQSTSVRLPPARHGDGVDEQTAVIITVDGEGGEAKPRVYLGDGTAGTLLPEDHESQEKLIREAVETGLASGDKTSILVKAARGVKSADVERVSKAAAPTVEGIRFFLGVKEVQ